MMTFECSNKYKVLAAAVAIILHGVAGVGLTTMQMLHIEPPKITPSLEIQMIKLNNEESPEPPKPEPTPEPKPTSTPVQSVAAPAPPKASPSPPPKAPKPEPRPEPQKELPKPKLPKPELKQEPVKLEPKVTEPQVDIITQERAQKAFELQQQREREQREREQQERERQAERDRQAELARQQAERDRQAELARQKAEADAKARAEADARAKAKAEADARAKAEADAKARAEQGQGRGGDGKDAKTDNKTGNKDTTKSGGAGGGELKGQNLSISNASWKSKPNWNGLTSEKLSGSANFVATLTIDANGKITSVSGVNTGDKSLDRQISQALRRARLHPFKSSSGQPMSGTATFSTTVQF